jgi:hypothetical protein
MRTKTKPTKSGVKAALIAMGYDYFPVALASTCASVDFTEDEKRFARYLIWDTDFGGAWNDAEQINSQLN